MSFLAHGVALLIVLAPFVPADIGPKPRSQAYGPEAPTRDMKGIAVEMREEEVALTLRKSPAQSHSDELHVRALFRMRNAEAEEAAFETGFPVGPIMNMTQFSVKVDGKPVPTKLVDRVGKELKPATAEDLSDSRKEKAHDFWHVWEGRYPAKSVTTVDVDYAITVSHFSPYRSTGYVLHTGAPWKGSIGRAVVTLACEGGLTLDHLRSVAPLKGAALKGDRIVWTFEDLEPTRDHDIQVLYHRHQTWQEEVAGLRREAATSWSARWSLASQLRQANRRKAAPALTRDELDAFLDAARELPAEGKQQGDAFVLPGIEPERFSSEVPDAVRQAMGPRRRPYAQVVNSVPHVEVDAFRVWKGLFADVLQAAHENPDVPKARAVVSVYRDFMRHFAAGDLHLDLRGLTPGRRPLGEGTLFKVPALKEAEKAECLDLLRQANERLAKP